MAKSNVTAESLLNDIRSGSIRPVYYLMGEESYYIDRITDELLRTLISEAESDFDLAVVYGRDTDMRQIISLCRQYPMMAKQRVVLVKEAQDLKNTELLSVYLENPLQSTVLIFNHKNGTLDRRKKTASELEKVGVVFESRKLYENELPAAIVKLAKERGLQLDDRTASLLAENLGSDLSRTVSELDKLKLCMPDGSHRITLELIERNIGISKEYNDFELQSALVTKDKSKAYRITSFYSKNPRNNPIQKTVSLLAGYFSNLMLYHYLVDKSPGSVASELGIAPFRVKELTEGAKNYNAAKTMRIIRLLRTIDAKSKGFETRGISDDALFKELLFGILH
jgi:DNA polymerase-3 subunit delta